MNARHRTKGPRNFLQMQGFLQVRGYVYLSGSSSQPSSSRARSYGPGESWTTNARMMRGRQLGQTAKMG